MSSAGGSAIRSAAQRNMGRVERGPSGSVDEDAVWEVIEGDSDRANQAVNAGGPTTSDLCDAFLLENLDALQNIYASAC